MYRYLAPNTRVTRVLYWYALDATVMPADFRRIGRTAPALTAVRARRPANLTRLAGWFLEFTDADSARAYYAAAASHTLCGFDLQLQFANEHAYGFEQPLLRDAPRRAHALAIGFGPDTLAAALEPYALNPDAVTQLPKEGFDYGEAVLVRFASETDARVFARAHDRVGGVFCEVVD